MPRKRARTRRVGRLKLSTTVAKENLAFLHALARQKSTSLAQAVDRVVEAVRRAENRAALSRETTAYFNALSEEELRDENLLGAIMADAAAEVDFERG